MGKKEKLLRRALGGRIDRGLRIRGSQFGDIVTDRFLIEEKESRFSWKAWDKVKREAFLRGRTPALIVSRMGVVVLPVEVLWILGGKDIEERKSGSDS